MVKPHMGRLKVRTEGDKPSAITCPQQEQVFVVPRSLNFMTSLQRTAAFPTSVIWGCRVDDSRKPKTSAMCRIKNCEAISGNFCGNCASFPCERLSSLDKKYRTKYGMSMIQNLKCMRIEGLRSFIEKEKTKWACPGCGATICVHKRYCLICGHERR